MNLTLIVSQNMEMAYPLAVLFGALSHWGYAYVNDPTTGGLWKYWFRMAPGQSSCTAVMLVTTILGGLAAGVSVPTDGTPWLLLSLAVGAGYAIDNAFNRSDVTTENMETR